MRNIIVPALLAVILVIIDCEAGTAYPNPRYTTTAPDRRTGRVDTVGIVTAAPEPAFGRSCRLDITYVVQREVSDSLSIYADGSQICDCQWDKYSHTWFGNFKRGDTLRCSFELTPQEIGTIGFAFRVDYGPHVWDYLPFGFVLDEAGTAVKDAPLSPDVQFGQLGLLPEYLPDTLSFYSMCCQDPSIRRSKMICITGKLAPKLGPGRTSTISYDIVSTLDLDLGLTYAVQYSNNLDVTIGDSLDWEGPILAGDTAHLQIRVVPIRPGVAHITLSTVGYASDGAKISGEFTGRTGRLGQQCSFQFVLDSALGILAYTSPRREGQYFSDRSVNWNDAYRLRQTEQFILPARVLTANSRTFEAKRQEFERQSLR